MRAVDAVGDPQNFLLRGAMHLGLAIALLETTGAVHNQALAQSQEVSVSPKVDSDQMPLLEHELSEVPNDTYGRFLRAVGELQSVRTPRAGDLIAIVDPVRQVMGVMEVQGTKASLDFVLVEAYKVSTAAKGLGNRANSDRTPTGVFELQNPEGQDKPLGYILGPHKSRRVGKVEKNLENGRGMALMTTRKVPVNGLESENKNALPRGIAVHGTNRERRLGHAASGGCIRMGNEEAVDFAEMVAEPGRAYMVIVNPKDPYYRTNPAATTLKETYAVRPEASLDAQQDRAEAEAKARAEADARARAERQRIAEEEYARQAAQAKARLEAEKRDCESKASEGRSWHENACYVDSEPGLGIEVTPYCSTDPSVYSGYIKGYNGNAAHPYMYRHIPTDTACHFATVDSSRCTPYNVRPINGPAVYYCDYPQ